MTTILQNFGEKLRLMRVSLGVSQEELAELAALDRTYISMLERGKRNPSLLCVYKLSTALNIPLSELIPETNIDAE